MDDLISRQAAIEAINKIFPADPMHDDYTQGITCGAALANIYVGQLPSAQPDLDEVYAHAETEAEFRYHAERKKGKWINIREGNRADCDQCGQSGRAWMNFCFDCGADMREECAERRTDGN